MIRLYYNLINNRFVNVNLRIDYTQNHYHKTNYSMPKIQHETIDE
jgi:hypothetical protein